LKNQNQNQKEQLAALFILAIALTAVAVTPMAYATTSEEDEEAEPAPVTPPAGFGSTITPPTATPAPAPAATAAGDEFVRTRLMLFGVPANSPNIVAWVNVPAVNATSADTITATELDATNNVTGDGIGEIFISLPNVTSAINQQIDGCALDVVDLVPHCDNAFQASTNASTMLQILLGTPQQAGAPAAPAPAAPTTGAG
jgi:hypothetical protein